MPRRFQFHLQGLLATLRLEREKAEGARAAAEAKFKKGDEQRVDTEQRIADWSNYAAELGVRAMRGESGLGGSWDHAAQGVGSANSRLLEIERELEPLRRELEKATWALQKANGKEKRLEIYRDMLKEQFDREEEIRQMSEAAEVGAAMHYLANMRQGRGGRR